MKWPRASQYRAEPVQLCPIVARGRATAEALALAEAALAEHDKALGSSHPWARDSARVAADALAALGRGAEAEALRARYGPGPAG